MEPNIDTEKISRSRKNIIFSIALFLILTPAIGTAILYIFVSRHTEQINTLCEAHMTMLGKAFIAYAKDHNNTFPPVDNWPKSIEPYVNDPSVYRCPSDLTKGFTSYAMNDSLGGKKLNDLIHTSKLVLLYEVKESGDSPHGDGKDIFDLGHDDGGEGRHGSKFYRFNYFLFADGSVKAPDSFKDTYSYYWKNGVIPKPAPLDPAQKDSTGLLF